MKCPDPKVRLRSRRKAGDPVLLGLLSALVALTLVGLSTSGWGEAAAAAITSAAPRQVAAVYDSADFGYHVDLPASWRHSPRLSRFINGSYSRGHDVFTIRSDSDELAAAQDHWLGPAWQGTVLIEVYRNSGLTAMQWATRPEWDWRDGQVVDTLTFAGRQAVRIRGGARFSVAYYVTNGTDIYVVGLIKGTSQPAAATDGDLNMIAGSFRFIR
jgi:hypothetical protein